MGLMTVVQEMCVLITSLANYRLSFTSCKYYSCFLVSRLFKTVSKKDADYKFMEITSLITVEIVLSLPSGNRSHLIKLAFQLSRERKDSFPNMTPEQLINRFRGRGILTSNPITKLFSE